MAAFTLRFEDDYFGVPVSNPRVKLPESGLQTRGEYHITIINPEETRDLLDRKGWTLEKLRADIDGYRFKSRPKYACLGKQEDGDNAVYYIVVKWPEAQEFRKRFDLDPYDFHVTLGFRKSDIHGVPKNASTCVGKLKEAFERLTESTFRADLPIDVPKDVIEVLKSIRVAGGLGIVVGGAVRDAVLGKRGKDIDVEVYDLPGDKLFELLGQFGKVNAVGKSFGVYKLKLGPTEIDFSLPRKDRKVGTGHRGFEVDVDHKLSYVDAAKRRDFTINTLGYDPLTGTVYDPHGGMDDLKHGVIRMTDPTAFKEDPLRVLRMAQFAARFGFKIDPETVGHAKEAPELETLPKERLFEEFKKALLRARKPGIFVTALAKADALHRVVPDLHGKDRQIAHLLDRVADVKTGDEADDLSMMLAAIAWETHPKFLESITNEVDLIRRVENTVAALRALRAKWPETDEDVRRWLHKLAPENLKITAALARLIFGEGTDALMQRVAALGGQVQQIVLGRHLQALGVRPGPLMGKLLKQLHDLQLAGKFSDLEGGLAAARELVAAARQTESTSALLGKLFFT